ncbi:RepB family plasmid replication initiator protein [Yersinia enterocolitica]
MKKKICIANEFVEYLFSSRMNLLGYRLYLTTLAGISFSRHSVLDGVDHFVSKDNRTFSVRSINELSKLMNYKGKIHSFIKQQSAINVQTTRGLIIALKNAVIEWITPEEHNKRVKHTNLISEFSYPVKQDSEELHQSGNVEITVNYDTKPFLYGLTGNYVELPYDILMKCTSVSQIKLYCIALIDKFKNGSKQGFYPVDIIKHLFDFSSKTYDKICEISKRLKSVAKLIEQNTGVKIIVDMLKDCMKGNQITHFRFRNLSSRYLLTEEESQPVIKEVMPEPPIQEPSQTVAPQELPPQSIQDPVAIESDDHWINVINNVIPDDKPVLPVLPVVTGSIRNKVNHIAKFVKKTLSGGDNQQIKHRPTRPVLLKRPHVVSGSHEEGEWARQNKSKLIYYREELKRFDSKLELKKEDLQLIVNYCRKIGDTSTQERFEFLILQSG